MTEWHLKTVGLTPDTKRLLPGDRVQLGFVTNCTGIVREFLWARICQVMWDGKFYFGVLEDDAKRIEGLKAGQSVQFWPVNIVKVRHLVQGDIY